MLVDVVLDLDDRGHGALQVAEEFQAHRAHVLGHAVQDERGRSDEPVAAFLLHAGQPGEPLVGDVLAEPFLAQPLAFDFEQLLALLRLAVGLEAADAEARERGVVNAPAVVLQALDLDPAGVGRNHAPAGEIVERGSPQHGLLAAGVHRDVAADARGVGGSRIDREHQARLLGRLHDALGDDSRAAADHRAWLGKPRQHALLDRADRIELLGVHHGGEPVERDRASRVAGPAAAGNDGEAQVDQRLHDRGALFLGVGIHDDERILDSPVGRVGDVRDARHAVELDVVLARDRGEPARHLAAQAARLGELVLEGVDRGARAGEEIGHAVGLRLVDAALVDLAQAVAHRLDEHVEPARAVVEVVLQVRVAVHDPDVAQHLVEHARRAPGDALLAQLLERAPRRLSQ